MYKHTLTYENYLGETVTEDFHFNLTVEELVTMETLEKEGLHAKIMRLMEEKKPAEIVAMNKQIIKWSYGLLTPEGRFVKSEKIHDDLVSSAAYSELFILFSSDAEVAADFINGITPSESQIEKFKKLQQKGAK